MVASPIVSRSARLFEIIQLLRGARGPVTAQAMAGALEVSVRTVYRDIAALQARRVPIDGEAGIGYLLRDGLDLPPLMFSHEELEAILAGLALLGRTGDRDLERAGARAAEKIADVVPGERRDVAPLHVSRWNRIPTPVVEGSALRRVIREVVEIEVEYADADGAVTVRVVKPLALIYWIDVVVLVGWCCLRNGIRHFRIDRLRRATPTGRHFHAERASLLASWHRDEPPP